MMESITYLPLYDRAQAGKLLAKKLSEYYRGNAVVVAIHNGGVPVASEICSSLELPLEVVGCKRIKHPANSKKSIGSICKDEVILHDCPYNLPQDYIQHQINILRSNILEKENDFYDHCSHTPLTGKIVIIVKDIVKSKDSMLACIVSIKKQRPGRVIVAVPLIREKAAKAIEKEVEDLVFLKIENRNESTDAYYENFPKVADGEVRHILNINRRRYQTC